MRKMFRVTYDVTTPESAGRCDSVDHGFVTPGDWHYSMSDVATWEHDTDITMTLREALELCTPQEDSGLGFSEVDGRDDYRTSANERRTLHPPENITNASYNRLRRLFGLEKR